MKKYLASALIVALLSPLCASAEELSAVFRSLSFFVDDYAAASAETASVLLLDMQGNSNKTALSGAPPQTTAAGLTVLQRNILLLAQDQLGKAYRYGAAGPSEFDCSGLIYHVFRSAGQTIARTSFEQSKGGIAVERDKLQVGDLVFFDTRHTGDPANITIDEEDVLPLFAGTTSGATGGFVPSKVTHSGIYIGEGKFIHASSGSVMQVVVEEMSAKYFEQRFLFAKRYLNGEL